MEATLENQAEGAADSDERGRPPAPASGRGGMARLSPQLKAVALGARALDSLAPTLTTRIMLRHFTRPRRKPGADYRHQLPAGARRLSLAHGERELVGWSWGESGPAVLLVHGWEDHSGSMLPFVEPLLALGFRVLAVDAPGHGLSSRGPTHLLDSSRALERVAAAHGPFYSIVAHSFGAAATCLMLSRVPAFQPERLALVSPMRDMEQHLEVFADIALLSPERAARLRQLVTEHIGFAPHEISAIEAIREFRLPGLVVHDRHDPVIPHEAGVTIAECWREASLLSTSNLGHRRILKCPRVLEEVLRLHRGA
jgi:pimeloyl-ACP methyl ester carboxylesterase